MAGMKSCDGKCEQRHHGALSKGNVVLDGCPKPPKGRVMSQGCIVEGENESSNYSN